MTAHFYAETNIWNAMCDLAVDAKALVTSLASKDATLVISPHITYELARTFRGKRPTRDTQGIKLFSCMKAFLDLDMPCSKELMELLHEEAFAYEQGKTTIDPLLDAADRGTVSEEVNKLANGIVEGRVGEFITKRTQHAKDTRAAQADHLTHTQATKTILLQVPESQLSSWLKSQAITSSGAEILRSHLLRIFGPGPTPEYALALLNSPVGRAARALVRADLYYNWRCAHRGSNPPDLMDDMLHVLQAIYCDVYTTADEKQSEYAILLLDPQTRVAICDRKTPIDLWLQSLARA